MTELLESYKKINRLVLSNGNTKKYKELFDKLTPEEKFVLKEVKHLYTLKKAREKKKLESVKEENPFSDDEDAKAKALESKKELDKKLLIALHKMIDSVK